MLNRGWIYERTLLIVSAVIGIVLGWVTGHWALSLAICLAVYLAWHMVRLRDLDKWFKRGARPKHAPMLMGAHGDILAHVVKIKKRHNSRRRTMQRMIRLFDTSAQNAPDPTLVVNANKEIIWMNKAARRELGFKKKRDIGVRVHSVWRAPEFSKFVEKAKLGSSDTFESPTQEGYFYDVRISPYFDDGLMLTARDVTQMVLADRTRRDFVSNASHELKTPLTVMMGYLEMLESDRGVDDGLKPLIQSASMQATRMHGLLNDLLSLSRIESSGVDTTETVMVPSMIQGIVDDAKLLPEFDHNIELDIKKDLVIKGGYQDLLSAFSNLVYNAILHTPKTTKITISWQKEDDRPVFSVKDEGKGISEEHLDRITERFYRVEEGRERSDALADRGRGTGLGLAIVKHVIQCHGGQLEISSTLGEGSEFKCLFLKTKM